MGKPALVLQRSDLGQAFQNPTDLQVLPIPAGFWNLPHRIADRANCETDESLQQLIPYIVLHNRKDGTLFTYCRGAGSAEARLAGNLSIGLGGHMDTMPPPDKTLHEWAIEEAAREYNEEAGLTMDKPFEFAGLIVDPTNPVGRVHLGVLAFVDFNPDENKLTLEQDVIEHAQWLTPAQLQSPENEPRLENWTKAALKFYLTDVDSEWPVFAGRSVTGLSQ